MSALAELLVKLGVDSAQFTTDLEKAKSQVESFGEKISRAGDLLKEKLEFDIVKESAEKLGEFVLKGAEAADAMGKLAQRTGLPIEQVQKLGYAANIADVSQQSLTVGLDKLAKNAALAAKGTGEQADAFAALGVKVTDANGHLRPTQDLLGDLAEKFASAKDGPEKAAAAMAVFGKSGADLIPFLNEGRDGIAKLGAEAESFGFILSKETAEGAAQFADDVKRLRAASGGLQTLLAAELAPTLDFITRQLVDGAKQGGALRGVIDTLGSGFKVVAASAEAAGTAFQFVGKTIGAVAASTVSLLKGDFAASAQIGRDLYTDLVDTTSQGIENVVGVFTSETPKLETAGENVKEKGTVPLIGLGKSVADAGRKAADEAQRALDSITKVYRDYQTQAATFGLGDIAKLQFRIDTGDLAEQFAKAGASAAPFRAQILEAARAVEALKEAERITAEQTAEYDAQVAETRKLYEETRTPAENYITNVQHLSELLQAGAVDQDTFNRAIAQSAEKFEAAQKKAEPALDQISEYSKQAARNLQDSFSQALGNVFGGGLENAAKSFTKFLAQLAQQAAASAILKALFGSSGSSTPGLFSSGGAENVFGSIFSGLGFASGGVPPRGKLSVVGEKGPELLLGDGVSRVLPNGVGVDAGNTAVSIQINFNGSGEQDKETQQGDATEFARRIRAAVLGVIVEQKRPGGLIPA